MIKRLFLIGVCLMVFVMLIACSNSSRDNAATDEAAYDGAENSSYDMDTADDAGLTARSGEGGSYQEESAPSEQDTRGTSSDRMVIYTADLSIEVEDYHKAQEQIQEHVQGIGGFVVESSLHHSGNDEIFGSLVVRVPQEKFYPFLHDLESSSTKVNERYIHGNDVTEEYVDLAARLRSKETVEERLLSFMDNANNTENLLKISNDLANVQEEIERLRGRMNYLDNHVAYSTVSIHIREKNITVASIQEGESLNTWKKAQSLFMDTINTMITFFSGVIIFVVGLSPIILPTLIIVLSIVHIHNKNKKKNRNIESSE